MTVRSKPGSIALALAAVMFVLYPAVRPWHDESTVTGARTSMASGAWVAAHFFAMIGFIAVPLGLLALHAVLNSRLSLWALLVFWVGAGLSLPYYGAEDFGLHALARSATPDLLDVVDHVRYQPVAVTIFGVGLILLSAAGVLAAVAVWRGGVLQRAAGLLFGVGFVLFLPQFWLPPAARIAHGVLVGLGCVWLAVALWRYSPAPRRDSPSAGLTPPSAGLTSPSAGLTSPSAGLTSPSAGPTSPSAGLTSPSAGPTSPSAGQGSASAR